MNKRTLLDNDVICISTHRLHNIDNIQYSKDVGSARIGVGVGNCSKSFPKLDRDADTIALVTSTRETKLGGMLHDI